MELCPFMEKYAFKLFSVQFHITSSCWASSVNNYPIFCPQTYSYCLFIHSDKHFLFSNMKYSRSHLPLPLLVLECRNTVTGERTNHHVSFQHFLYRIKTKEEQQRMACSSVYICVLCFFEIIEWNSYFLYLCLWEGNGTWEL